MIPYSELVYFLAVLALLVPMLVASRVGRSAPVIWLAIATLIMMFVEFSTPLKLTPDVVVPELFAVVFFGVYQLILVQLALRFAGLRKNLLLIPISLVPIVVAKYVPMVIPSFHFGFGGISYVTFRSLDVLWSITDGVLKEAGVLDLLVFVFFFPTISSGPIDRFRRFRADFRKHRTWDEVMADLDAGVHHVFQGLLFKFVIATLIEQHLMNHAERGTYLHGAIYYAFVYSAHLYFDFAGYSAFAVGVSRWFGIKSPENFKAPWAAPNIREFWNRWHISLSVWFRDHVYMRFLLTASKRKWFKNRDVTSSVGYFVSFGLMGVWHCNYAVSWQGNCYYLVYGFYHASLLAGYDAWARWRKRNPERFTAPAWKYVAHALTIIAVVFGLWLFSGHGILTKEPPTPEQVQEQ
jgi:membrane protein involved in D-alanine export